MGLETPVVHTVNDNHLMSLKNVIGANVLNDSLGEYDCKMETQRCWGEFKQTVEHVF